MDTFTKPVRGRSPSNASIHARAPSSVPLPPTAMRCVKPCFRKTFAASLRRASSRKPW